MTVAERVSQDLTAAMKSRDAPRTSALRMAKAALKNREIDKKGPLDDAEAVGLRDGLRRVGQRFMIGFDGFEASADAKRLIRDYGVGHVILFARNVASPEQVAELVRELQECARRAGHETPLLMAVDQEG